MTVDTYTPPTAGLARWVGLLQPAAALAERIANTEFVPEAMRGNAAAVCAAIMYGDELGIGPMQALAGINVIKGKPSPSAELMRALVIARGHQITVLVSTGTVCRIQGKRAEESEPRRPIEWTIDMARAAGLMDSNPTYRRYPRSMLLARATSELCREVFPDVVKGLGHLADDVLADVDVWAGETGETPVPDRKTITTSRTRPVEPSAGSPGYGHPADDDGPLYGPLAPPPASIPGIEDVPLPGMPEPPEPGPSGGIPPSARPSPAEPPDVPAVVTERAPVNDRTLTTIHTLFSDLGLSEDDRPLKLAIASAAVNRPIESTKHLTRKEGLQLVGVLNDLVVDLKTFAIMPDGTVEIYAKEDYRNDEDGS